MAGLSIAVILIATHCQSGGETISHYRILIGRTDEGLPQPWDARMWLASLTSG